MTRRPFDPFEDIGDEDRLSVFVPAIMSVGLVFSVATLIRDAFRWTGSRTRERRTSIEAHNVLNELLDDQERDGTRLGLLGRSSYLLATAIFLVASIYITIGSIANYLRPDGYVRDIAWLLALALTIATLFAFLSIVSIAVFRTWPNPPAWTSSSIRTAPLSVNPNRIGQGPPVPLTGAMIVTALTTLILGLMVVTGRGLAASIDQPLVDWLTEVAWLDKLAPFDPFGSTIVTIAFVALIGLSSFRCRVMAVVYPAAFVLAWSTVEILQHTIARARPSGYHGLESFPSGHMVQVVFIAGLLPPALNALFESRRLLALSRIVLFTAVVATGIHRIHLAKHWPLDVIAGLTLGSTIVLAAHWTLQHRLWHRDCDSCPWSPVPGHVPWRRGLISLSPAATRAARRAGAGLSLAAAIGLAVLTVTLGLPEDPEGAGLGSQISSPIQLSLAALMAIAALIATRWAALAAFMMAVAAIGLGLFAAIEYAPPIAFAVTVVLGIPAILTWIGWQPTATLGRITALAVLTATALVGTGLGVRDVNAHYFGPTHPSSLVEELHSAADWLWLGSVTDRSATISAGGLDPAQVATLHLHAVDDVDGSARTVDATTTADGVARFAVGNLEPLTTYRYWIDDGGDPHQGLSEPEFTTFASGAQNLRVAIGSCARRSSNGRVFDAIVDEEPDLYLALGDLHYGNITSTDPSRHITEYARSLRQPAQAALFSSIPTAYVWDDHDYGPNDADSTSPTRPAVGAAYRTVVPSYSVEPDAAAPIAQAFTVGRVRFIMTDTRSQRTATTILGAAQLDWLLGELTQAAADHAVVVWANPTPWIGRETVAGDGWSSYPDERRIIADTIAAAGIDNLVMVSGDAHMVAIDDGTNTDYSTTGGGGFPILHAAALDRPGSIKGGPYSHGAFPGGGQYGVLDIVDGGGDHVMVTMRGMSWDNTELVRLEFQVNQSS